MMTKETLESYEMTIGIECHVQLATDTKLFSGADNDARDKLPNTVVSPIDFGLPGMLPVLNKDAVMLAIKAGFALGSKIANVSRFDRKHYFYPDLPKGYQTTQLYHPIIIGGIVATPLDDGRIVNVRIHHAHIEEDAGKLTHFGDYSLVDLNRAGTPLIEIVSEPDIHSAAEAKAYATELYRLMTYAGVTRGDLYHGNMRFDVNVSVAKKGASELGTRAEVKNLNSFKSVEKAAEYEFIRQVERIENGDTIVQETRGWDDVKQKTSSQRSKEDAQDYRYMPDADIPPVILDDETIKRVQSSVGILPPQWRLRLEQVGLDTLQVNTLLDFDNEYRGLVSVLGWIDTASDDKKLSLFISNFSINIFIPLLRAETISVTDYDYLSLQKTIFYLIEADKLSSTNAKALFKDILIRGTIDVSVEDYALEKGYIQESDSDAIQQIIDEVLEDATSAQAIIDIQSGNEKVVGFLVGQVMKRSGGKANPVLTGKMIIETIQNR